jgi:hypothetical protein
MSGQLSKQTRNPKEPKLRFSSPPRRRGGVGGGVLLLWVIRRKLYHIPLINTNKNLPTVVETFRRNVFTFVVPHGTSLPIAIWIAKSVSNPANTFNPVCFINRVNFFPNSLDTNIYYISVGVKVVAPNVF